MKTVYNAVYNAWMGLCVLVAFSLIWLIFGRDKDI